MRPKKLVEWGFFLIVTIIILYRGVLNGINPLNYSIEIFSIGFNLILLDAIYSNIVFSAFMLLGGLLLFKEVYSDQDYPENTENSKLEAIIPVYNDSEVLHKSVESLNNSDYENLEISVVCEEEDEKSIQKAEELDCNVIINQHPGSKAGAINTVFEKKEDSEYFAIFDADETVQENFLVRAVGYLEEGYQGFQGRRVPKPTGLVEKFAYCERALFHAAYKITEFSGFRNLRSSSTVMKREVWEEVGGYEDLLTEDLDFPHKCFRNNIKIKQDRRCTNLMEAPHTWKDFWGQRKRWSMGQIQILHKALRGEYSNNFKFRGMISSFRIFSGILVPILMLGLLSKFLIILLLGLEFIYVAPIISTSIIALIISYKDSKEHSLDFIGFYSLLTSLVIPFTAFLNIKAFLEYILTWSGEWYEVDKKGE